MRYCTCNWAGTEFNWRLIRNTVFTEITPGILPSSLPLLLLLLFSPILHAGNNATDAANKAIDSFPEDSPAFAIIAIGDGSNAGEINNALEVMNAMSNRKDGRNYYYVLVCKRERKMWELEH